VIPIITLLFNFNSQIGVVDQINNNIVLVELSNKNDVYLSIPIELFPCKVSEQDKLYIKTIKKNTKIKCH
jgi:hypothetical protein